MKFTYLNDTKKDVHIHPATKINLIQCSMEPIKPLEMRVFVTPEGKNIWTKMWDHGEHGMELLVSVESNNIIPIEKPSNMGKQIELKYVHEKSLTKVSDALWKMMMEEIDKNGYSELTFNLEGLSRDIREIINVNKIKE